LRKSILAGAGGVAAAFLGALCCTGPLIFITFGVGAGLAGTFEPLRPLFGGLMVGAFALGFYSAYGRPAAVSPTPAEAADPVACPAPRKRTREKVLLWIALVVALVMWTFPTWSVWLV
jgi:hypothetical protein